MLKIAGKDVVKGLPKMEKIGKGIYGSCQLGNMQPIRRPQEFKLPET
jgi:hypothetical protein